MGWVEDIIDSRGGTAAVAAALDLPETTVSSWIARGIIRPGYWPSLLALPVRRGRRISLKRLARLACAADADRLGLGQRSEAA
jgi:hypothetical protein